MKLSIALLASSLALAVATASNPPSTTLVAASRASKASLNITIDDGCVAGVGRCGGGGHPADGDDGDDGAVTGPHGGGASGGGGSLTNNNALAGLFMLVSGGVLFLGEF